MGAELKAEEQKSTATPGFTERCANQLLTF